jgi:hypothetical protein
VISFDYPLYRTVVLYLLFLPPQTWGNLPCVIFLSYSCHIPVVVAETLSYSLCFSNQTDQGDQMEGLVGEVLEGKRLLEMN